MSAGFSALPTDLWIECLSFLPHGDLARALCTCKTLAKESAEAWKATCYRRWPRWAAIAAHPGSDWRRVTEFCCLRESEQAVTTMDPIATLSKSQDIVKERHRAILAEWMCEVSFEWNLESSQIFDAIRFLDHFLKLRKVTDLTLFQLIGLACLRVAMGSHEKDESDMDCENESLHPSRFVSMSADVYTEAQVLEYTEIILQTISSEITEPPNAKMFLRTFWQHALRYNIVESDEMHLYILASFFLQIGLLHLPLTKFTPSLQAAAALSIAFDLFGRCEWPTEMKFCGSYEAENLHECKKCMLDAQSICTADRLRKIWFSLYQGHGYGNFIEEWNFVLAIVAQNHSIDSVFTSSSKKSMMDDDQPKNVMSLQRQVTAWRDGYSNHDAFDSESSSQVSDDDSFRDLAPQNYDFMSI